jgi:polyphenol oxidase
MNFLVPEWPLPGNIQCVVTTQFLGNIATHAGDLADVHRNREILLRDGGLPREPVWLSQVHGSHVLLATGQEAGIPTADAAYTRTCGLPLAVMVADCLPILIASCSGEEIAVVHAGWRGLAREYVPQREPAQDPVLVGAGVIHSTVSAFGSQELMAWLGPAIGPCHYEVDRTVRQAFPDEYGFLDVSEGHWMMDLHQIARRQLNALGITRVFSSDTCTRCDDRFFSYRHDRQCGRFAAVMWKSGKAN